jgi:hypothetical protein
MRIFRSALFLMMVSALGCAGSQPVRLQLPPEARIGILNLLEPQMTHVDFGSLRFDSFSKVYNVDWDIPGYLTRTIENDLRAGGNFTFIPIAVNASEDWKQSMSKNILSSVTEWVPDDLKVFLNQTAEEERLDLIISVSSYDSDSWPQAACFEIGKNPVATKGYGLYTRTRVLSGLSQLLSPLKNTATPYANIVVAIFQTRPVTLASHAQAPCSQSSLADFPWSGDLKFLSPEVIRKVKPHVEQLSAEAAHTALANAGLLP